MKKGKEKLSVAQRTRESATNDGPIMAIPFPPGASPVVAEEAHLAPHFTQREKQVGGWLAEGKSDPEIAEILTMGLETVRTHIKAMREKVEVYSRNALFAWIWRNRVAVLSAPRHARKPVKYK